MNAVVIFDVNNPKQVRELMRAQGYATTWSSGEGEEKKIFNLPSNVVWKPNTELQKAYNDLVSIVAISGNKLERCMVLNSTPWFGVVGFPVT